MNESVGIRELRQNLSHYLRHVATGTRYTVTDHNLPVAVLGPLPDQGNQWDQYLAANGGRKATRRREDWPTPVALSDPRAGTRALEEERADRISPRASQRATSTRRLW